MRRYCALLCCTLWILLLGSCRGSGHYVVETGNLEVISPRSLQGLYESSVARFGIPEHEGALAGEVVYTMDNQKGCYAFDRFDMSFRFKAGSVPTILLIDRGDCFFSLKVYNAQKAGAAAVLIMDDRFEPLIVMENPDEVTTWQDDYMLEIDIPSALISKSFGDKIKEALSRRELVIINLAFNYPNEVASPKCQEQLKFVQKFWEDSSESRKEDEEIEARPAGDIGTWNWTMSDPSGPLEIEEDIADTNDDRISDQDESSDMAVVGGENANQRIMSNKSHLEDGDHEKGSDLVLFDIERRSRRSESATKYIAGRWNPGKMTNPGGWQVRISSRDGAEYGKWS